jgi:septal ring factor EnvC (AmiA/AmiB activator)
MSSPSDWISLSLSVVSLLGVIAAFITLNNAKITEAEKRGALIERVKQLESKQDEAKETRDKIDKMSEAIAKLTEQVSNLTDRVKEISEDVKKLRDKEV